MKSKFGSKALSLLLSLTMVLSMVPAMTLSAGAANVPTQAETPGSGYYPQKYWNTGTWGNTEPTTAIYNARGYNEWKAIYSNLQMKTSLYAGQTLSSGVYYIGSSISLSGSTGQNGLAISGDVTLIIPTGVSLTARGGNATNGRSASDRAGVAGGSGAGAGIYLPSGSTLHIVGSGAVYAYGGNAGNGGNGTGILPVKNHQWNGGGAGGGGGGGGAGIGTKGSDGTYGGFGSVYSGATASSGTTPSLVSASGTLVVTGAVTISATGGSAGSGGYGGTQNNSNYNGGNGGGGGGGGAGQNIGVGGSGGAGGGGGGAGGDSWGGGGGGGGAGGYGRTGYASSGRGGYGGHGSEYYGGNGSSGSGRYGGSYGSCHQPGYDSGRREGASGGSTALDSSTCVRYSGSYYYRSGLSGIGTGSNYVIWPKDECKIELVSDSAYNSTNQAWMYTGRVLNPSVKITHIPTGQTTTVSSGSSSYTSGAGGENYHGGTDGYGEVTVKYGSVRLVLSNKYYTRSTSQKFYFPIKETVSFDTNAENEIEALKSAGISEEEAAVSGGQSDKLLQIGVTDSADAVLATANVPKLFGYQFLGWYYYDDSFFDINGEKTGDWTNTNGDPAGMRIYNPDGSLNTASIYLTRNGNKYRWDGKNGNKAITQLYAMWKLEDITLVLNAHGGAGGGTYPSQTFGSYFQITAPSRTGYTFDGYYDEAGYDNGKFTGKPVAKMDGNDMVYLKSDGSYGASSDGAEGQSGLKLTRSYTLHAKWKALEYTVRLWSVGSDGQTQYIGELKNVESGALLLPGAGATGEFSNDNGKGRLVLPDGVDKLTLERNHYDFMGWNLYSDQDWAMFHENKESKFTPNSATVDKDGLDIYAAWKIKDSFDIQYNGNEGNTNGIKMGNVFKGEDYTIPATLPTRAGYSFISWNTALNGSGDAYQPGDTIQNVTKAMTLYAQWAENNSITYNANGGTFNTTLNTLKPAKGEQVTLTIPATSDLYRTGYEFLGWSEDKDAESATYTSASKTLTMGDSSVILYAVWKPVQVAIEYTAESGQNQYFSWGDKPTTFTYGKEVEFTIKVDTTKAGANTLRVSVNGNAKSVGAPTVDPNNENTHIYTFKVGGNVTEKQTVTVGGLTARSYNVSLDLGQGGTIEADKNVTYYVYGAGAALPTEGMAKKGYTFGGWYADETCTGSEVTNISSTESGDKTFYAKWNANPYTVTYNANGATGGTAPSQATATYDQSYTIASGETMVYGTGVEFLGWSTDSDAVRPEYKAGDKVLNLATGENGDTGITLYAVWKVPTFTINYVLMGGTADGSATLDSLEVKTGTDAVLAFKAMVRSGYSFMGWDTNKDASNPTYTEADTTAITNVTGNVTLYAIWKPITYNIVFHNGDATYRQETLSYGEKYQLAALSEMNFTAPEDKGNFLGWSATPDAITPQYLAEQNIKNLCDTQDGSYDLYAVWGTEAVKYLSYDANGGTWKQHAQDAVASENEDGTVDVQFNNLPEMEGYDFAGWWLSDARTITVDSADQTVNLKNGNATLYATWTARTYTVQFDGNGADNAGTVSSSQTINYDAPVTLSQNSFTREGYQFLGWSEDPEATAPTYQDKQSVLNLPVDKNGAITLYAVWQQEDPIYITYNANGGSGAPVTDSAAKNVGVTISDQIPTREGYTFLGWATNSDAGEAGYMAGQSVADGFTESTTLYAVWQMKQTHKVSYDVNGGYGSFPVDSNSYYEGDRVNVRFDLIPAKSGYTFAGWKNGETVYSNQDGEAFSMGDSDVTLTAQWTANHYTIQFNAGNGSGSMTGLPMTYGTAAKLTANGFTAPTGYSFAGWAVAANGGVTYEDQASVQDLTSAADGEVTLYAVWMPLTVKVTLNKDYEGGTDDTVNAIYGQQLPVANQPARDGYTFGGYYTERNGSGKQYYNENMVPSTADFTEAATLYAKWTAKTYQIVYMQDVNKEAARQDVTYGTTPTIMGKDSQGMSLTVPDGSKLAGWATSETGKVVYKANDKPENLWNGGNAVVLYAVFKKDVTYTVKYDKNGGTGAVPVDSKKYEDGDFADVQFPTEGALYNNGSQFLGWSTDENASAATYTAGSDNNKIQMTDNVTLYAVWVKGTYNVKYDGNGGTLMAGQQDHIDNVEMLRASYSNLGEIYQRSGYTFEGWNRNQANASKGVVEYGPTAVLYPALTDVAGSTVTLYAAWTANEYKVTFNPDGGTVYETERTVTYDKDYGTLPVPTREGCTFKGWFIGDTEVKGTTVVQTASDHTLIAKWQGQQYTVTANTNNAGTISMMAGENELTSGSKADAGTEITVTVTPREYYTIDNVTLYVNGTPVSMSGDESNTCTFTLTKDTEVALKANGNTGAKYTVVYNKNAEDATGEITNGSFIVGQSAMLSDGAGFTRNGYNLTGWNTRADGNGTSYGLGTEQTTALTQTAGGTVTLYAQWSATNCTVNFVAGEGAQLNETSKNVTFGEAYGTLPTPTKDGSVFDGWYLNAEYEGDKITSSTIVANAGSHTLYAKWVSAQYTVTVNDNSVGTIALNGVGENNKAAAGTAITVTVTPRDGYTIDNLVLHVGGDPVQMVGEGKNTYTFTLTKDTTVVLQENKAFGYTYTVEYDANTGNGMAEKTAVTVGKAANLSTGTEFSKTGYTLTGWNTAADGKGTSYALGAELTSPLTQTAGGTVTLYAVWTANTYTVTFNAGNDATLDEKDRTVTYGQQYGVLPKPELEGMVFGGWFTEEDGTGTEVQYNTLVSNTANHALYAKWTVAQYTVTLQEGYDLFGSIKLTKKDGSEVRNGDKADYKTEITATVKPNEFHTIDSIKLYVNGEPVVLNNANGIYTYTFWLTQDTVLALNDDGTVGVQYLIIYDSNGSEEDEVEQGPIATNDFTAKFKGAIFHRDGYTLMGWSKSKNGDAMYDLDAPIQKALSTQAGARVRLYAVWAAAKDVEVTFIAGDGAVTPEASKFVTYRETYGTLPVPTKTGYRFDGWYLSENCNENERVTNTTVVANSSAHKLYAKWTIEQYTVTVVDNGLGTIKLTDVDQNNKADYNTEIIVTVTPKEGRTIDSLILHVGNNPVQMTGNGRNTYTFTLKEDTKVVLQEKTNVGIKYTVSYDANTGLGKIESMLCETGREYSLASEGFTKEGFTLAGWNTKADGSGKAYSLGETVQDLTWAVDGTVTLYAQWTENNPDGYAYTIRYEANGGDGEAYEQAMHQNLLDVPLYDGAGFSRNGYKLAGWARTANGTSDFQLGGKLTAPLAAKSGVTVTLYAVWEKDAILVTLIDPQGVNTVSSLTVKSGETYDKLPTLTKAGYTFDGWFTEATGGTRVENSTEVTVSKDHTLYAHWTQNPAKTYTVAVLTSDVGTVTLSPQQSSYAAGTEITVTVTPASGKSVKLISNVSGEVTLTSNSGKFVVTADTILALVDATTVTPEPGKEPTEVPDEKKDDVWYLFYNGNGGSGSMSVQTQYENATVAQNTFSRDGYSFVGWNTEADGTGFSYAVDDKAPKPDGSKFLTLYAQWEAKAENTYTVTLDPQGGTMSESTTRTYHKGDKYGKLPTPAKSGDWHFGGWYSDSALENRVDDTTPVLEKDHTLYAKWISRTAIAVTAAGYQGVYDANSHVLAAKLSQELTNATYQWFKDGKAISGATGRTYSVKNVADSGKYTCVVSGSYEGLAYANLESTAAIVSITKAAVTVSASGSAVYGGEASYRLIFAGFLGGENEYVISNRAAVKASSAYVTGSDVGTYSITISLGNASAANYELVASTGTLTVTQRVANLRWPGANTFKYDGTEKNVTAEISNLFGNDDVVLNYSGNANTAVGKYKATVTSLSGAKGGNYTLSGAAGLSRNWEIYADGTRPNPDPEPEVTGIWGKVTWQLGAKNANNDRFTVTFYKSIYNPATGKWTDTNERILLNVPVYYEVYNYVGGTTGNKIANGTLRIPANGYAYQCEKPFYVEKSAQVFFFAEGYVLVSVK